MPTRFQVTVPQNDEKVTFSSRGRAEEMMQQHNPNAFITIKHERA